MNLTTSSWLTPVARAGLISKGIVYCLNGILAFMAAFEIHGQSNEKADKEGAVQFIRDAPAGNVLLGLIAIGLFCYAAWRMIEVFRNSQGEKRNNISKKIRYFFSGLVYLSLAVYAAKMLFTNKKDGEGSSGSYIPEILNKPAGEWILGAIALTLAGIGIYQLYYGLSEKYKKHVSTLNLHDTGSKTLLRAGKIGYVSRGIVWLIISYMLLKAAIHSNANEAGDTGKAFQFLEDSQYGSYLLGALALGLICYGVFNFIRARYEEFT